jgi:hypothetical protein
LFIPGNALHGITAGADGCSFAYGFAVSSFASIAYRYSGEDSGEDSG